MIAVKFSAVISFVLFMFSSFMMGLCLNMSYYAGFTIFTVCAGLHLFVLTSAIEIIKRSRSK